MSKLTCRIFQPDNFSHIAREWDGLNTHIGGLPILNSHFIKTLCHYYVDADALVVQIEADDAPVCIGFFEKVGFGRWQTCMPSQLPVCMMVTNRALDRRLAKAISRALPGVVLQVDFLQCDPKLIEIDDSLEKMAYIETGMRAIPGDFESYFAGLGKNLRQNYNKVINRASREALSLSIHCVTQPDEVKQAVITYGEIESQSWKADGATAIAPDNHQGYFYQALMEELARNDQACVWLYKINDSVAAVDLCVHSNGVLIILKTTYKEEYGKFSPALQLKVDMLRYYSEHAAQGVNCIEFYGKAMDWHKRLQSTLRPLVHTSFYPLSFVKWLKRSLR